MVVLLESFFSNLDRVLTCREGGAQHVACVGQGHCKEQQEAEAATASQAQCGQPKQSLSQEEETATTEARSV